MTTLRDCAVEVMADAMRGNVNPSASYAYTHEARVALDALLVAQTSGECPECEEARKDATRLAAGLPDGLDEKTVVATEEVLRATYQALGCSTCDGTGSVSAGPLLVALAVEAGLLERCERTIYADGSPTEFYPGVYRVIPEKGEQ